MDSTPNILVDIWYIYVYTHISSYVILCTSVYVSVYVRVRALVLTWTALVGDFDEFLLIRARISLAVATGRSQKLAVAFLLARFHHVLQQRILWESMHKGFFL